MLSVLLHVNIWNEDTVKNNVNCILVKLDLWKEYKRNNEQQQNSIDTVYIKAGQSYFRQQKCLRKDGSPPPTG